MVAINWSIASLILLLALIPEFLAILISFRGYLRYRYKFFQYMLLTWVSLWLSNGFILWGYLTLDFVMYNVGILFVIPLVFSTVFMVDSLARDSVDPLKLVFTSILSALLVAFSFTENSVELNTSILGEDGPSLQGPILYIIGLIFIVAGLLWFYYMLKVYLNSPKSVKKYATINLIGAFLAGPGSMVVFITGTIWLIPGTDYFLIGVGALFLSYAFWKQPQLGYVLPFQVYQLMVVDSHGSIPLFTHTWNMLKYKDTALFSGALSGITSILKESLGGWNMEEIQFDMGRLIITYTHETNLMFVLITSSSNSILRNGLKMFQSKFISAFSKELRHREGNLRKFDKASDLIHEIFPFVLEREGPSDNIH